VHESGARFLGDAFRSLQSQTLQGWEWVIVENNGGRVPDEIRKDDRVQVLQCESSSIGELKRFACIATKAPHIVELDCDDELEETALARVLDAFIEGADFVYSDCAYWQDNGDDYRAAWQQYPFREDCGWRERYEVKRRGMALIAQRAAPVTPQNLRRVEWSPDHLRAWTRDLYERVGGHDATMQVGDDHDLMVRALFNGAKFRHIPECLYFYRCHGEQAVQRKNAEIQAATQQVYDRNIWQLAELFTAENRLASIDLCGGIDSREGYTPIDRVSSGGIECDLEGPWWLEDNSVGVLRAHDAVEHLRDPVHTMNEAFRVLAPGGFMMISVPSSNGVGAFCDPTHVSFWNKLSFRYYADPNFMRYVPAFKGRFQIAKLREHFPSDWHRDENMPYIEAHLIRLGDGYEPMGALY